MYMALAHRVSSLDFLPNRIVWKGEGEGKGEGKGREVKGNMNPSESSLDFLPNRLCLHRTDRKF